MKSANPTATIRPDVLLLAAERVHHFYLGRDEHEDFRVGRGSVYCCDALVSASKRLGLDSAAEFKSALFDTFGPGHQFGYIWDPDGTEYEARILGLLLLREMLKPERKRRPKTVKRKRALR